VSRTADRVALQPERVRAPGPSARVYTTFESTRSVGFDTLWLSTPCYSRSKCNVADKSELLIRIGLEGQAVVETRGLKGQACLAETKELEAVLGRVKKREKTREFYETEARATTKVRNR